MVYNFALSFAFSLLVIFFSCQDKEGNNVLAGGEKETADTIFTLKDYYSDNPSLEAKVNEIYNSISDGEKVAQLIISSGGSNGKSNGEIKSLISEGVIGGTILLGGSKDEFVQLTADLQNTAVNNSRLPLIISTDGEPSLINRKIAGIQEFPKSNTITTEEESRSMASEICMLLNEMGINQNYAPVCDYGYNQDIISNRSFGGLETNVGNLASAFIKASQENGVIATAKHFPGHGNVSGDSHNKVVYINGEMEELNIFQSAIDAGVISVMAGHIAVKNNPSYNTNGLPATLSNNIITGLLREEMGFKGLVVTDGMNMGAVTKISNASYKAFIAGCDLILMEPNERNLHSKILGAMKSDKEVLARVEESAKRIIKAKICLGLL